MPIITPLDVQQEQALQNLKALLTFEETGIERVSIDALDSINETTLVIVDLGMQEARPGNSRREIRWDLGLQVYIQKSDLETAHQLARSIRARLIDRLGDAVTLGGAVSSSQWAEPLKIVQLDSGATSYLGLDCVYTLWIRDARTFE